MRSTWIAPLATIALLTGCGGSGGNKAGAPVQHHVSFAYEVPDDSDPPAAVFAQAAGRHTNGTIRVDHDKASPYTSADPVNEVRLARALEAGRVKVAYMPARAWAVVGIPEFRALLAPFALTTEDASRALASSPIADAVLQSLPKSVVGLALVPQEARRILAISPPTSIAGLEGVRLRVIDNPETAAAMRAAGVLPLQGLSARDASRLLLLHRLDGVESAPTNILQNGYQTAAHYFSTWSPFAKFQVIVMNREAWDQLSPAQQAGLRQAARITVAYAQRTIPNMEKRELIDLCGAAGRPAQPTRAQLGAIASRMRTIVPRFVNDPAAKELLARIERLPGTGVQPLATPLPFSCRHPSAIFTTHAGGPKIPLGTYKVTTTVKDWLAAGLGNNPDFRATITTVTRFNADGTYYQSQTPNYPDQGPWTGRYYVHGDELTFVNLRAGVNGQNSTTAPETVRWSYFDGKLTLENVGVRDPASRALYAAHPWVKVR